MQHVQPAAFAASYSLPDLANYRVVAVDERGRCHDTRCRSERLESFRLGGIHCERLLANHMLAGGEDVRYQLRVQTVGNAYVDDRYVGVDNEIFSLFEDLVNAQVLNQGLRRSQVRVNHANQVPSGHACRLGVHTTDEASSDDPDANWLPHSHLPNSVSGVRRDDKWPIIAYQVQ